MLFCFSRVSEEQQKMAKITLIAALLAGVCFCLWIKSLDAEGSSTSNCCGTCASIDGCKNECWKDYESCDLGTTNQDDHNKCIDEKDTCNKCCAEKF